jgi:hypothetical protein
MQIGVTNIESWSGSVNVLFAAAIQMVLEWVSRESATQRRFDEPEIPILSSIGAYFAKLFAVRRLCHGGSNPGEIGRPGVENLHIGCTK